MGGFGREKGKSQGRMRGEVFVDGYDIDDECYFFFLKYLFRYFEEDIENISVHSMYSLKEKASRLWNVYVENISKLAKCKRTKV